MTEIDNDKLISQFMKQQKQELPDHGFSRRVMHRLPDREQRLSRIWIAFCSTIGVILFFLFDGFTAMLDLSKELLMMIAKSDLATVNPLYLLLAAVVLISLGVKRVCAIE